MKQLLLLEEFLTLSPAHRRRRVRIRQIDGDDGLSWCLLVDRVKRYSGMDRREAEWRRSRFIEKGEL